MFPSWACEYGVVEMDGTNVYYLISPGQNGRHFADDIFKCIFTNENFVILIQISLKYVPTGLIDNKAVLIQVMT